MAGPVGGALVEVSEEALTEWAKGLAELAATPGLSKLVRPAPGLFDGGGGVEIDAELSRAVGPPAVRRRRRPPGPQARRGGEATAPPEALVELLSLRVHALGGWAADPLDRLADETVPADEAGLRRAAASSDPLVAAVAGLLHENNDSGATRLRTISPTPSSRPDCGWPGRPGRRPPGGPTGRHPHRRSTGRRLSVLFDSRSPAGSSPTGRAVHRDPASDGGPAAIHPGRRLDRPGLGNVPPTLGGNNGPAHAGTPPEDRETRPSGS